ncbi:hypothetical protein C8039_00740 [Halogeometricum sp. wsp3]|nr:hypothetical protein C8039_00740 [Halogeometricum sp. wsp3]
MAANSVRDARSSPTIRPIQRLCPADAHLSPAAGEWRDAPGHDFFETVEDQFGDLPFIVEDLGFLASGRMSVSDRVDRLAEIRIHGWSHAGVQSNRRDGGQ